jgi:tape measure domain-containing protein
MALRQDEIVISYKVEGAGSIDGARAAFDKLTQAEKDAIEQAKKLGKETEKSTNQVKGNVESSTQSVKKFGGALDGIKGQLLAAFSVGAVLAFGKELVMLTAKMEQYQKRINFASGSAAEGGKVTQYLTGLTRKYGLELETVIRTYSSFAAASKASNLSQEDTIKIFEGVTKAVAAFGLSAEQSQGAFLAITQMISKGTVSAEELRGQLGERLPGSFAIAARSIGVTEKALGKMLEQGQVISRDFLPKFAAELEKTFGEEAAKNVDTLTGKLNLLSTNWTEFLKILGKNSKGQFDLIIDYANNALGGLITFTSDINQIVEKEAFKVADPIIEDIKEIIRITGKFGDTADQIGVLNDFLAEYQERMEVAKKITKSYAVEGADELNKSLSIQFESAKKVTEAIEGMIKAILNKPPPETESDADRIKRLTKEYQALIAELERQEKIQIRLKKLSLALDATAQQTMQNEVEVLEIKAKFGQAALDIDKRFYALGLVEAGKNSESRILDVKEANKQILAEMQKFYTDEFNQAKSQYDNLSEEAKKFNQQRLQDQQDSIKKRETLNEELQKIDEKAEKEKKERAQKNKDDDIKEAAETNQRIADENMLYLQESLQLAQTVFNGFMNLRQQALAAELSASQRLFDEQLRMFEGNEEMQAQARDRFRVKEREIRQKQFRAEQQAAIANAIFTAAPQIVKYASVPPLAAIVGATLVAQIGFIAAQKMPEFAKGTEYVEGPGTGTSDSIMARLSKGERVMTARQNKPLLDMGIKNDDIPKIVLDYMSLTSGRTKGSNSRGIERKLDDLNRSIKSLPVAAISLDGKGFSKSIRSGNRTSVILNNQFVN